MGELRHSLGVYEQPLDIWAILRATWTPKSRWYFIKLLCSVTLNFTGILGNWSVARRGALAHGITVPRGGILAFITLNYLIITWTSVNSMMHNMFKMNPTEHFLLSKIKIFRVSNSNTNKFRAQSVRGFGICELCQGKEPEAPCNIPIAALGTGSYLPFSPKSLYFNTPLSVEALNPARWTLHWLTCMLCPHRQRMLY